MISRDNRKKQCDPILEKCRDVDCQICKKRDWTIDMSNDLYLKFVHALGGINGTEIMGIGKAVVPVRCKGCGHILLFSAEAAGIDKKEW